MLSIMSSRRRVLALGAAGTAALLGACAAPAAPPAPAPPTTPAVGNDPLAAIEAGFGGRLGVFALDTATGRTAGHRADERFLLCSTSKMPTAAAITVSDNTAENLLLRRLGGPKAVEAYLRTIGDGVTSLDRYEPELNARQGTLDTSTPRQMATTLQACTLGAGLDEAGRRQLTDWLVANTTGGQRIRAGLPAGWRTGDKTGSGDRNEVNDVAVTWPPAGDATQRSSPASERPPVLIAVYTEPADPAEERNVPAVPAAAAAAVRALGF